MLGFFNNFSNSFLFALFLWPFVALFMTLPVLLVQYIRFHKVYLRRIVAIYLLFLYVLALFAFTLYPLPDNPEAFCVGKHLTPQLNPLQFFLDIQTEGLRAVLQVAANVVFFVPLGVFVRNLFGGKLLMTVLVALAVSLAIETAQLTGAFGVFPCSYRLFDVDDLIFNVLGAVIGAGVAVVLPNFSKLEKREGVNTNPKIVQRAVVFVADFLLGNLLTVVLTAPLYFMSVDGWQDFANMLRVVCFGILQFGVPLIFKGQTVFGALTGVSLDDRQRNFVHRVLFYGLRGAMLGYLVFGTGVWHDVLAIVVGLSWIIFRKMPYKIIDIFFRKK
ncbi:MAG: VanZ family protein [Candidatus Nomurabacteria bacterium]|jgi:glycopeptide antibiotics resistance protein|nr:VanZ family protein [Candidatus Nomurabacteria bacterium]